jgi:hypothetical protein
MLAPNERATLARRAAIRYLRLWAAWSNVPWSDQVEKEIAAAIGEVIARARRRAILKAAYGDLLQS